MINPVNTITTKYNKIEYKKEDSTNQEPSQNTFELADYKTGQAILARNNISFKSSAEPVEVTHLYNKKTEGKDHLDLPNVHVYEFPDTNLQVFLNADNNIELDSQKISIFICNNNEKNYNFIKTKLLYFIMKSKIKDKIENFEFEGSNFGFTYHSISNNSPLETIPTVNNILTNLKFNNDDLELAKITLIEYLKSLDYKKSIRISQVIYESNELKTNDEITNEIEQITTDNLNDYYKKYKEDASIQLFLTMSKDRFENNKYNITKLFNSGITQKFHRTIEYSNERGIQINKETKYFYGSKNCLYYPVKYENNKDDFLGHISACILNILSNKFTVNNDMFLSPIQLKDNIPIKHQNYFYYFDFSNSEDIKNHINNLETLCSSDDFSTAFEITKQHYKERLKNVFTSHYSSLIKHFELMSYCDDIFNLYETIDSITENDVKEYIKTYFIEQKPIIELYGEK